MKSHAMKHCTIIYDGPALSGVFCRFAPGEAALMMNMYLCDMRVAVEQASHRLGYQPQTLLWSEPGIHPLRMGFACPDAVAEDLRMALIDQFIIELDPL